MEIEYNPLMTSDPKHIKPWLNPQEQVEHLKSKGVRFNLISENEAIEYLSKNSNYFRLKSYRTGFPKVNEGPRKGEYANLDFKMLIDLSIVDMLLRYEMLPMTLDIEHFAKVSLLQTIEAEGEDGYEIVSDYLKYYDTSGENGQKTNVVKREIQHGESSPYVAGIIRKYPDHNYPVWAFLELITFGRFVNFYKFCAIRFSNKTMLDRFYLLQCVKRLRNACAHNNCILNELASGTPMYRANHCVSQALSQIREIGASQRKAKMKNDRLQQIATTLYVHRIIVSKGVHDNRAESLHLFVSRMNKHIEYYTSNCQIPTSFDFITKIINAWFSTESSQH